MEIIKRTSETEKQIISTKGYNGNMQVSYNNFGHIALRFFGQKATPCEFCNKGIETIYDGNDVIWVHSRYDTNETTTDLVSCIPTEAGHFAKPKDFTRPEPHETLIVLDLAESNDLIRFIKERLQ